MSDERVEIEKEAQKLMDEKGLDPKDAFGVATRIVTGKEPTDSRKYNPLMGSYTGEDVSRAMLEIGFGRDLVFQIQNAIGEEPQPLEVISFELKDAGLAPPTVQTILDKLHEMGEMEQSIDSQVLDPLEALPFSVFSNGREMHLLRKSDFLKLANSAYKRGVESFMYYGRVFKVRKNDQAS